MSDQPLAARMRPRTAAEFVGQTHLVGPGRALQKLLDRKALPSMILWGPAGTGKTTLAYLLADAVGAEIVTLSAVSSGVGRCAQGDVGRAGRHVQDRPVRRRGAPVVEGAAGRAVARRRARHRDLDRRDDREPVLLVEHAAVSRCLLLRLEPLSAGDVAALVDRALQDTDRGLGDLHLSIDDDALAHLVAISGGDARMALTGLEAAALAAQEDGVATISLDLMADAVQRKAIVYDRQGDAHYDVISAFIKSIRGRIPTRRCSGSPGCWRLVRTPDTSSAG